MRPLYSSYKLRIYLTHFQNSSYIHPQDFFHLPGELEFLISSILIPPFPICNHHAETYAY